MKATGFNSLRINCWNITQIVWICKIFSNTLTSYYILLYSVVFIKKINVLSLRHWCFPGNVQIFLKQQKQSTEVFRKKRVLKNFAIFTRKHLCWSLFGVFGVNIIKKALQHRCFPVNITKFLRTPASQLF